MSLKRIILLSLSAVFLFNTSSCIIHTRHEHRKHNGWSKNKNNPHHPKTTNPGRGNVGKGHPKGHSKK
ncbi:MAG: hypothetical protein ACK4K0_00385 [Flavobacteriales bacterium]